MAGAGLRLGLSAAQLGLLAAPRGACNPVHRRDLADAALSALRRCVLLRQDHAPLGLRGLRAGAYREARQV